MHAIVGELEGIELVGEDAEAVLIGGADETPESNLVFSYMNLARAFHELEAGAQLYSPAQEPLVADQARAASGRRRIRGRARVRRRHGGDRARQAVDCLLRGGADGARRRAELTWMVGDDIEADIGGAQAHGMRTMLVRTESSGRTRWRETAKPDGIVSSIAQLPDWLEEQL